MDWFLYDRGLCHETVNIRNKTCRQSLKKYRNICDALPDLVPFVQFKKREKHPWKSVTFSKVAASFGYKLTTVLIL